jgi:type I restriction enzyme S subunit
MSRDFPPGWSNSSLGEHVDLLAGFAFKSARFTEDAEGIRLLRGDNIAQGRLRWNDARRWSSADRANFAQYELARGDVVIAMDRPWIEAGLKCSVVRIEDVPSLLVQRVARLRAGELLDQRFLRAVIEAPAFTSYVRAVQTGTAVPHISAKQICDYPVRLPPLYEQRRISSVLEVLDDKIESNRRLAGLLEQIAQAEFQARFVDFVGAEEVDGARGVLPTGWMWGTLTDAGEPHREPAPNDLPYIGLDRMPRESTILDDWVTEGAPTGQSTRFDEGDILFGKLRPYFKKVGVAPVAGRCSTEILVLRPSRPELFGVLLGHVSSQRFIDHCVAVSRGTRMPRAEWRDAGQLPIAVPPMEIAAEFTEISGSMYAQIQGLTHESRTFAATRDALLPKLVSGQIRVPDTADPEEVVGPVAEELVA